MAPLSYSSVRGRSASKAFSSRKISNSTSCISGFTPMRSWVCPGSKTKRARFPSASTSATIFIVRPPSRSSDRLTMSSRRAPVPAGGLGRSCRRSWHTQSCGRPITNQTAYRRRHLPTNVGTVKGRSSSYQNAPASLAMALSSPRSTRPLPKISGCLRLNGLDLQ